MTPLERVLSKLETPNGNHMARCPAHDDHEPSLSVSEGDDGRVLLKCHAGCDQDRVLAALEERGIAKRDLFPGNGDGLRGNIDPSENASTFQRLGLTLDDYAEAKGLTREFLESVGVGEIPNYAGQPAVLVPYMDKNGGELAVRFRLALEGDRFRWRKGSKPALYGLWKLGEAREEGWVVVVEGESDAQTLWHHDIPAVGVPGAATWRPEWAEHLDGIKRVYAVVEPDRGGEALWERLAASPIRERLFRVELGGPKDVSELHLKNADAFVTRFEEAIAGAVSYMDTVGVEAPGRPTQAQLLVQRAAEADLFHTPGGEAYGAIPVGDHRETQPIKSKGFRRWLMRGYYDEFGRPPGAQAMQDALSLLEARAHFDGPEEEVYVRVAGHEGAIYVDLANERWEAVEITASGWRVVREPPVRFRRPRGMLTLPTPQRGDDNGHNDPLRPFFNLRGRDEQYRLVVAWLVQALRPIGPYPALILLGEQGSAKSTAERLLRSLVDPSVAPLRTTPRNEHDLVIAATNSWCVAFDNISMLPPWCSDALCRLSTGGGFSARELYTDNEEVLFDATRPVILNGITDVATRPDLLDRALIVTLPPIPEDERRPEAEIWREFEKARPAILAQLFDAVAGALATIPSLRLERVPRMADFALWATAAEGALGWEKGAFMEAYTGNRQEATEGALDADPVADTVRKFMADREEWTGTATDLWDELSGLVKESIRHTKAWPGAPNALSNRLKRLAPALRDIGIEYSEHHDGSTRAKTLRWNTRAKNRKDRKNRKGEEKEQQKGEVSTNDPNDDDRNDNDPVAKGRKQESAANSEFTSDSNDLNDDLRAYPTVPTPGPNSRDLSPLARTLAQYLHLNPHRAKETPSWLAATLWAKELFKPRQTPETVAAALDELRGTGPPVEAGETDPETSELVF